MTSKNIQLSCLLCGVFAFFIDSPIANADDFTASPENVIVTTVEDFRGLDKHRDKEEWSREFPTDAAPRPVAFSVSGERMQSHGKETVITYEKTQTNTHPHAWIDGGSHFRAPVAGIYLFTVSFTNEKSHGSNGDDVYVLIRKNGTKKGFACTGESGSFRESSSYTVALDLAQNDIVHTGVVDDSKGVRYLRFFNFTGALVQSASP